MSIPWSWKTILGAPASAADAPFWTESPPGQAPKIQAPNFAELAEPVQPAVVNISTTQVLRGPGRSLPFPSPFGGRGERDPFQEFFERFFGRMPQSELRRRNLGSGFLINKDGHIVTNNHAVENATDIKVSLSDAEEFDATAARRMK